MKLVNQTEHFFHDLLAPTLSKQRQGCSLLAGHPPPHQSLAEMRPHTCGQGHDPDTSFGLPSLALPHLCIAILRFSAFLSIRIYKVQWNRPVWCTSCSCFTWQNVQTPKITAGISHSYRKWLQPFITAVIKPGVMPITVTGQQRYVSKCADSAVLPELVSMPLDRFHGKV